LSWVYLATAPDQLVAEMWRDLLVEDGIAALVRSGDTASYLGVSAYPCRVLVREDDRERAKKTLEDRLGRPVE
jgi:hypothetical protein